MRDILAIRPVDEMWEDCTDGVVQDCGDAIEGIIASDRVAEFGYPTVLHYAHTACGYGDERGCAAITLIRSSSWDTSVIRPAHETLPRDAAVQAITQICNDVDTGDVESETIAETCIQGARILLDPSGFIYNADAAHELLELACIASGPTGCIRHTRALEDEGYDVDHESMASAFERLCRDGDALSCALRAEMNLGTFGTLRPSNGQARRWYSRACRHADSMCGRWSEIVRSGRDPISQTWGSLVGLDTTVGLVVAVWLVLIDLRRRSPRFLRPNSRSDSPPGPTQTERPPVR